MFVRRLVILFIFIALGAIVLVARLAQLQLLQAQKWQAQAQTFIQRHYVIETSRGAILDRLGRVLAIDKPCYDLPIDYRAMNLDDLWITQQAVLRLNALGLKNRRDRLQKLPEIKAQIAQQILAIPQLIATSFGVPVDDLKERFEAIRERMDALKQTQWTAFQYNQAADARDIAAGLVDPDMNVNLKEESVAHTIVPAVPDNAMFTLDKVLDQYPGLRRVESKRREYPYGAVAAHLIGALRPISKDDYDRRLKDYHFDRPDLHEPGNLHGYLRGDDIGSFGVERLAENDLRGTRGVRLVEVGGEEIPGKRQNPMAGNPVRTTLDIELQAKLTQAFMDPARKLLEGDDHQDHNVALIIMSLNGEVLTMISTPTYDLNTYRDRYSELVKDTANHPLLNRALQGSYPPGSTVKPLVATAALAEAVVTPVETVVCTGHLYPNQPNILRCDAVHGAVSMERAIEESCNVYFYTMGKRLGLERLTGWYQAFGLGVPTGIGIEEAGGSLPNLLRFTDADMAAREAIQMGIGQGSMVATPMQMACAYATVLRGGVKIAPRLLLDDKSARTAQQVAIPPAATSLVRHGMELVVAGAEGTAFKQFKELKMRLPIGGKTGTATVIRTVVQADGTPAAVEGADAWFVGYAPADKPQYVIVAVKEFGGHGGRAAVPLVQEAVLELERQGYLPPVDLR